MATYIYNTKKINEIIRTTQFNRASMKHATGITNETTAIRWEKGEDIYVTRLCQIASYTGIPLMDFFFKSDEPLTDEDAPAYSRKPRADGKVAQIPTPAAGNTTSSSVNTAGAYTETDILKMQLEHQKQIMEERERYHTLEMQSVRNEENIRKEVREEYNEIVSDKNKQITDRDNIISEKNKQISEDSNTISTLRAEIETLKQTIAMMGGKDNNS